MTESNRLPIIAVSTVAMCAIAATVWMGVLIQGLRTDLELSRKESQAQISTVIGTLDLTRGDLARLRSDPPGAPASNVQPDQDSRLATDEDQALPLRTYTEATPLLATMKKTPTAAHWAATIAELDGWLMVPKDQDAMQKKLAALIPHLRALVKKEVTTLQNQALTVQPSSKGAATLDKAGRILALYPMSDDVAVVEEAQQLADRQLDAATRLDALRRQRYNKWAIDQVEQAINYYNANVSKWNPLNDNTALLPPLVKHLGPVDPLYLEPAVLDLYNYIIDKMKGSLSEMNKLEFAKRLTDPAIPRKALGDL